jgi:GTP-binding protein Era
MESHSQDNYRCGTVAVLGVPNAGKSTLVNTLIGSKISIVTPKVQTTRALVKGIALNDLSQIVFLDTPGIFEPKKALEKVIVESAWQALDAVDFILLVIDATKDYERQNKDIFEVLKKKHSNKNVVLVLNKIDKIKKENLLRMSQKLNEELPFLATFMVSALKGDGVSDLLSFFSEKVPLGPWLYPEDQISDMPMRSLAAEITREKLFLNLHQELPYELTVETELWENFDNGSIKISQVIFINRKGHKSIILGKKGEMIKRVGRLAREELKEILGTEVHLKLFVKVQQNWMEDPERFSLWGLDHLKRI